MACNYRTDATDNHLAIEINEHFKSSSCVDYLTLKVELRLKVEELSEILVAIIEVPSGYTFDNDDLKLTSYATVSLLQKLCKFDKKLY